VTSLLQPNAYTPAPATFELGLNTATFAEPLPSLSELPVINTAAPETLEAVDCTRVWGIDFARVDMQQVIDRADRIISTRSCRYFITANLNYLMLTAQLPELSAVNAGSDLNIADGYPIVLRSRLTASPLPCRVAGSDMIVELARLSASRGYRIYFLGAAPGVASAAADKLCQMFPELQVAGCCAPPFRPLSEQEHHSLLTEIRSTKPDILLVAFGQPKGERWIYENYRALGVPLSIQLGASFDFLAGTARRAPSCVQAVGCEWLYRSISEPRRLGPRYARNIAFLMRRLLCDATGS
jgi:N-acetylglucosaminyldiphosphoundecaprenol N-acetyl-beta-D-mannosaminyltransferase